MSEEPPYWVIRNGERSNGGMTVPPEGVPANWFPYFAVEDVDAAMDKARGGRRQRRSWARSTCPRRPLRADPGPAGRGVRRLRGRFRQLACISHTVGIRIPTVWQPPASPAPKARADPRRPDRRGRPAVRGRAASTPRRSTRSRRRRATRRARSTRTSPPRRTCSSPSTSGARRRRRRSWRAARRRPGGGARAHLLRHQRAARARRRLARGVLRVLGARDPPPGAARALRGDPPPRPGPDRRRAGAASRPSGASSCPVAALPLAVASGAMQIGLALERLTQPEVVDEALGARMGRLMLDEVGREKAMRLGYDRRRIAWFGALLKLAKAFEAQERCRRAGARAAAAAAARAAARPRARALGVLARADPGRPRRSLERVPPLDKAEMMARYDDLVTDPAAAPRRAARRGVESRRRDELYDGRYRVMTTSGSSGRKGLFVYDRAGWSGIGAPVPARLRLDGHGARHPAPPAARCCAAPRSPT